MFARLNRGSIRFAILSCLLVSSAIATAQECGLCAEDNPFVRISREARGLHEPEWFRSLPAPVLASARRLQEQAPPEASPTPPRAVPPQYETLDPKHRKDLEDDIKLGESVAREVEREFKVSASTNLTDRVRRIGNEFAEIANMNQVEVSWGDKRLNPFTYTFTVLEGDDINAFSLPGGFIYFYEGLLKYVETDHELAGVMAHEVAHAAFRHVATLQREQSRLSAVTLPLILIGLLSGTEAGANAAIAGSLTSQAIGSGWSVRAEKSADLGGFQYMRNSKYDPVGLLTFMERLAFDERAQGRINWGIYKSHPPSRERVAALSEMIKESGIPLQRSRTSTTLRAIPVENEDGSASVKLMKRVVLNLGGENSIARAEQISTRLNTLFDSVPAVFEIEGRPSGEVIGRGQTILTLQPDDVKKSGKALSDLTDEVVRTLKAAAFELQYRVWEN